MLQNKSKSYHVFGPHGSSYSIPVICYDSEKSLISGYRHHVHQDYYIESESHENSFDLSNENNYLKLKELLKSQRKQRLNTSQSTKKCVCKF